jgi:hypothetical protein
MLRNIFLYEFGSTIQGHMKQKAWYAEKPDQYSMGSSFHKIIRWFHLVQAFYNGGGSPGAGFLTKLDGCRIQ